MQKVKLDDAIKQLKSMFGRYDDEALRSILEAHGIPSTPNLRIWTNSNYRNSLTDGRRGPAPLYVLMKI